MEADTGYLDVAAISVASDLFRFVEDEALRGSGVSSSTFWSGLSALVNDSAPRNRELLGDRARLQRQLDDWYGASPDGWRDPDRHRRFLEDIGYVVSEGGPFRIDTAGVDPEIAEVAAPQLVVPLSNARYAVNAANARWGSLYDALYGTDALGCRPSTEGYDPRRGAEVIRWVKRFLDEVASIAGASHEDVSRYAVGPSGLEAVLVDGSVAAVAGGARFAGFTGSPEAPSTILLDHRGLGVELVVDRDTPVGAADPAGVSDVLLEAAVTTIMDCEDSVATVDSEDKVAVYRNWLGLMRGDLVATFRKGGRVVERTLAPPRRYLGPDGSPVIRPGRSLLLVRHVGLHLTTSAVLDRHGDEAFEGLVDAAVTVLCALHDRTGARTNSPAGSVYVVKPKLHGPAEVAFAVDVLARVEAMLGLEPDTVKLGLMDEERRTSLNLAECIRAARHRLVFVNTGFLDRTGDEVHTSRRAGPMVRKDDMRSQPWLAAYETRNVAVALACGLAGRAQIGKGMWAAPDDMARMLADKVAHPESGASCAWVPSPTAATLHATHYHRVDVRACHGERAGEPVPALDDLLRVPVVDHVRWSTGETQAELDNNLQGILGYVVRWVDLGIGCSKVPDIGGTSLMEDRATCRISSQLVANWLHHGIVSPDQVRSTLRRMASIVDEQNAGVDGYEPMGPHFDGPAFQAACDLVFLGGDQPSGYTEAILHGHRSARKRSAPARELA